MGNEPSSVRASHFRNQSDGDEEPAPAQPDDDDFDKPQINISNKMVERLVEDAALVGGAKAAVAKTAPATLVPKDNYKDILFIEKIKRLDDSHSEKTGLTEEEVNATIKRIEMRSNHLSATDTVCEKAMEAVLECYNTPGNSANGLCWKAIQKFSKCVEEEAAERIRQRTAKDAREQAWRSRHIARARESALRDLGPRHERDVPPV